jgi:hypothetical protein
MIRCAICKFEITDPDLTDESSRGPIHFDRQCPKGTEKVAPKARKTAERKLAEGAGIVVKEMKIVGARGVHAECDHETSKSARAACRRAKAAGK